MNIDGKTWLLTAAAFSFGATGVASAQSGLDEPNTVAPSGSPELMAQQEVSLSGGDMKAKGATMGATMDASRKTLKTQLRDARSGSDVVKTLCLEDKLNQVDTAISSATVHRDSLERLFKAPDSPAGMSHELLMLGVLKERVAMVMADANQCLGNETGFIGEAEVIVEIDENIAKIEPTVTGGSNGVVPYTGSVDSVPVPTPPRVVSDVE